MKRIFYYKALLNLIIASLVLPMFVVIIWAVSKSWAWPSILPTEWGIRSIEYLINPRNKTLNILANSLLISMLVTIFTLIITIPAGKALGQYDFYGKEVVKLLSLAPLIVPSITVAMGIHVSFIKLGLANKMLGVILMHTLVSLPYGVRIFTNFFEIFDNKIEESAKNLGARRRQVFFDITMPMIAPSIVSAGSLIFTVSFSQYFLTFLIGGGRVMTLPMVMIPFIQSGDRMLASAYSLLFISTSILLLFAFEKSLKLIYKDENFYEV
jgi:putative spermidine/putrescine transport system permease protein